MIFTPTIPMVEFELRRAFWKAVIWTANAMLKAAGARS